MGKASVLDIGNATNVVINGNSVGLQVDDGSTARIQSSTIVNTVRNVVMTFGSRGDFEGNTIGGRVLCDKTVLIRGDENCKRLRSKDDD